MYGTAIDADVFMMGAMLTLFLMLETTRERPTDNEHDDNTARLYANPMYVCVHMHVYVCECVHASENVCDDSVVNI